MAVHLVFYSRRGLISREKLMVQRNILLPPLSDIVFAYFSVPNSLNKVKRKTKSVLRARRTVLPRFDPLQKRRKGKETTGSPSTYVRVQCLYEPKGTWRLDGQLLWKRLVALIWLMIQLEMSNKLGSSSLFRFIFFFVPSTFEYKPMKRSTSWFNGSLTIKRQVFQKVSLWVCPVVLIESWFRLYVRIGLPVLLIEMLIRQSNSAKCNEVELTFFGWHRTSPMSPEQKSISLKSSTHSKNRHLHRSSLGHYSITSPNGLNGRDEVRSRYFLLLI